jgi:hypothetical protein
LDRIIILFSDINGSLPNIEPTCTKSRLKNGSFKRESPWEVEKLRFRSSPMIYFGRFRSQSGLVTFLLVDHGSKYGGKRQD